MLNFIRFIKWRVLRFIRRFGNLFEFVENRGLTAIFLRIGNAEDIVYSLIQKLMG